MLNPPDPCQGSMPWASASSSRPRPTFGGCPAEVAEHTSLDDVLKLVPVLRSESGGLREAGLAVGRVREHAIEHNDVEVEARV